MPAVKVFYVAQAVAAELEVVRIAASAVIAKLTGASRRDIYQSALRGQPLDDD